MNPKTREEMEKMKTPIMMQIVTPAFCAEMETAEKETMDQNKEA